MNGWEHYSSITIGYKKIEKAAKKLDEMDLSGTIGHEIGHIITFAALDAGISDEKLDNRSKIPVTYRGYHTDGNYRENWDRELAADKIGVAINPEVVNGWRSKYNNYALISACQLGINKFVLDNKDKSGAAGFIAKKLFSLKMPRVF